MKFIILIAICVLSIVVVAQAADKCTINGKTLDQGEKYQPPGKCEQYECFGKNGVIHTGCPKIDSLKPCKYIPQDPSKPYPKCCASQKC
uniref:Single domain-containing protein n=1 Tax=Musca domestica TaxID=7370 RepID=A0A1I8NH62_MUSDO